MDRKVTSKCPIVSLVIDSNQIKCLLSDFSISVPNISLFGEFSVNI